jgi:CubicO group peptidase (beta-lactamase class C family)
MRFLVALLICSFGCSLGLAQIPADTDRLMAEWMRNWEVPGMAVGVVQKGKVVHLKGYGLRDVEAKLPVTTESRFAYGSITKSLTVLLLHGLAAEGKMDWDGPVRDQLPGFKLMDPVASERTTPRDLVSHRTGMPRHDGLWAVPEPPTREEVLARLRYLPASADFRTTYQYNNLMFLTAGILGARAAGEPWEKAVRGRVLEPLGLGGVAATYAEAKQKQELAVPYVVRDHVFEKVGVTPGIDVIAPAGASVGTIAELTRYLMAHMGAGKVEGKQLLPAKYFEAMQRPHTVMPETAAYTPFSAGQAYGMGLFIGQYRGKKMIYHTGTISGYHAMMWWMPEEDLGVTVLLNRVERALPHVVCLTLADRILGLGSADWSEVYKKNLTPVAAKAKRVEGTQPGHPLRDYVGKYRNAGYGEARVTEAVGGLVVEYAGQKTEMKHWHYDTFGEGAMKASFVTELDGEVGVLRLPLDAAVAAIEFRRVR